MAEKQWTITIEAPNGGDMDCWIYPDTLEGLGISKTREAIEGFIRDGLEELIAGELAASRDAPLRNVE